MAQIDGRLLSNRKAVFIKILPMQSPGGPCQHDMMPSSRKKTLKVNSGDRRRARRAQVDAFRRATRALLIWMRTCLPDVSLMAETTKAPLDATPASTGEKQRLAQREAAILAIVQAAKYFIIVLDAKGGLGKSLMLQVAYEAVSGSDRKVLVLDADKVNSNLSRIGLSKKEDAVRADRKDFEGFLLDAAEQLELGLVQAVVVDSAAGGEEYFNKHLKELAKQIKLFGGRLIVIRPITTNPLNQDNAVAFGRDIMTDDMGVVMVRNLGQGRTEEDFAIWTESPERAEMLQRGMLEVDLEAAGALYSDLATGLEISIADIARKRPNEMGLKSRKLDIANRYFTRPVRLFIAKWMLRQTITFRDAFAKGIRRTVQ